MGGQESDKGVIRTADGEFNVTGVEKLVGNKYAHHGVVVSGMIRKGSEAEFAVDNALRSATCKNHSATHLLQKALRDVLGSHVEQQGSYQDGERTRFDFSHFQAMTAEELKKVEDIVNEKIAEGIPVETAVMSVEEAKKTGAMALFGEKYGETVRVVSMGDFSKEFCGGTHVKNTSDIGQFKILSENGVAAGVRRVEAITGANVRKYYSELEEKSNEAAALLKTTPFELADHIKKLQEELRALKSENTSLKSKAASGQLDDIMDKVVEISDVKFLAAEVKGADMNSLRDLGDKLKEKLGTGVILLASESDGKVNLVSMATDDAIAKGAHAGNLIKGVASLVGGGGGGRPNMAQAGGKDVSKIDECLASVSKVVEGQIV
jgi:alanyl-tRNA synthetase